MDDLILFDWLSFTSKSDSVDSVLELLGLHDIKFTDMYGMQGFLNRFYFEGISIHYNSSRFEGVWVEMSGQGCRAFETYSDVTFPVLLKNLRDDTDNYHISRLDVAFDDHSGILDLRTISRDIDNCNFVSLFHNRSITYTCAAGRVGYTIDCGSRKSDIKFRIYDKAFERNREAEGHWVRFEIQLRDDRALELVKAMHFKPIGVIFCGVITNYLRFVVPDLLDSNKRRWNTRRYWSKLVGSVEPISLTTRCNVDYNLAKCEDYVYRQCGNALDTLIKIKGVGAVVKELKQNKPTSAPKYKDLINSNKCVDIDPVIQFLAERGAL